MASIAEQVWAYTANRLERLLKMPESGPQRAALANLRRGVGRIPGDVPELWGVVMQGLPENLLSTARDGEPTNAEWAIYTALTLFALHQQSRSPAAEPMHIQGREYALGRAVSRLVHSEDDLERVKRRFNAFATSADMSEMTHHLRGLVQLLRAEGIPLDYAQLAQDLYRYQFADGASGVRLQWGQDFYRYRQDDEVQQGKEDKK